MCDDGPVKKIKTSRMESESGSPKYDGNITSLAQLNSRHLHHIVLLHSLQRPLPISQWVRTQQYIIHSSFLIASHFSFCFQHSTMPRDNFHLLYIKTIRTCVSIKSIKNELLTVELLCCIVVRLISGRTK